MSKDLSTYADEKRKDILEATAEVQRDLRAAKALVRERDEELAILRDKLDLFDNVTRRLAPPPKWLAPVRPKDKLSVGIPTLFVTDVHWDEVVNPEEVDGANKYNRVIAEQRLQRAFTGCLKVTDQYLHGLEYQGAVLLLGGDMISGIIHEELRETNSALVMDSVLSILDPLRAGINLLAQRYGKLHVAAVVGNHGRNTRKPRAKGRVSDSFDWLIYKLLERDLRGDKRITMQVATGADVTVPIYNTNFLLTHGDQFQGGSGISGLLAPLMLGAHRKQKRQSALGKPYDIMVMGHWHQSLYFPSKGLIVGGSVVGYNEYEYLKNFTPEPAQCAFWVTTPEHGPTFPASVYVQDKEREGW